MRRLLTEHEAEMIRATIRAQGRRERWLAEQVGIDHRNFCHMLARRRRAPEDLVERCAAVLNGLVYPSNRRKANDQAVA